MKGEGVQNLCSTGENFTCLNIFEQRANLILLNLFFLDCTPPFEVYVHADNQPDPAGTYSRGWFFVIILCLYRRQKKKGAKQILAKQGLDSRFVVEANIKSR